MRFIPTSGITRIEGYFQRKYPMDLLTVETIDLGYRD
jgi:hypothetical protein